MKNDNWFISAKLRNEFAMRDRMKVSICVVVLLITHMVVYFGGHIVGHERGVDQAVKQISAALKEEIGNGRVFRLKGVDLIRFHPRKDQGNDVNYTIAGSGDDTRVRGAK